MSNPVREDIVNVELVKNLNSALGFFDDKSVNREVFHINNEMWMLFSRLVEELKKHYPEDDLGDTQGNC